MPRPMLPRAREIADIAKTLRAEGFTSICIETTPDGSVSIQFGEEAQARSKAEPDITTLQRWRAKRGTA